MAILLLALALQFCDGLTTVLFLRHGVIEGNPLAAALMHFAAGPAAALLLLKLAGCGLALYAWKSRRTKLLQRANIFFAVCVGWNLLALARA